jgi:hypothetical protein
MDSDYEKRTTAWLLDQEARGLLTRLARVKPFALQETILPAAALSPAALIAIERFLVTGRLELREQAQDFLRWLATEGADAGPEMMQRRFTLVRLRFNVVLSHFDLFSEVITQRSESETGVWLAGLDVLAADALAALPSSVERPQLICYVARGPGAAIRRAKTQLPGGGDSPVGIIRIPRERMVGHGIGSSLVHEVGHQAAALLDLMPSLRPLLHAQSDRAAPRERQAWRLYERWVSEVVADMWSVGRLGIGSTLGLIAVVSLPSPFVFRLDARDPHPSPWIRVKLSCTLGDALYPHPQWEELAAVWEAMYPRTRLDSRRRGVFSALEATMSRFASLLVDHRPRALGGASLRDVLVAPERRPGTLAQLFRRAQRAPEGLREGTPTLAFAALGQARSLGLLDAQTESRVVGNLLTYWALRSTLDIAEICAAPARTPAPVDARIQELQPT